MKVIVLLVFMLPCLVYAVDLDEIRREYHQAITNQDAAERFYKKLKKENSSEPIVMAYFGATQTVRAKHAINPYTKLSYLKAGIKTLDAAVGKSGDNLEIRFLRFTLEHYIPSYLGYNKHLVIDRTKIVELVKQKKFGAMDKPLLANLFRFMKETKRCSLQEIAILDQAIAHG